MKSWLALGDSYTIGESAPAADCYPAQTVKILKADKIDFKDPEIIATTGWTTTDLLSAIAARSLNANYDLVTLLIGVNNQYQRRSLSEYEEQFTDLLQKAIYFAAENPSHVIVLSIPDYSITPFAREYDIDSIARQIDSFNLINKKIALASQVHYINVTDESRKAGNDLSLLANDGLHYSGKEYAIWAILLANVIQNI
jgi:lysophospholipase L1-like esterase